ncbi:hypothetical protein B0H13DRAFT_1853254 [Mycena leptocephala]|nr:hypothetical protein B0H13DRAFT_1853254 [Mycena leptocephala]
MREFPRTGPTVSKPLSSLSAGAVQRVDFLGEKCGFWRVASMISDHNEKSIPGDILGGADFAKPVVVFLELREQRPMSNGQGRGAVMAVVVVVVMGLARYSMGSNEKPGWEAGTGWVMVASIHERDEARPSPTGLADNFEMSVGPDLHDAGLPGLLGWANARCGAFGGLSLAFGIAVFGRFPAKIHREMPKNRPKRKLINQKYSIITRRQGCAVSLAFSGAVTELYLSQTIIRTQNKERGGQAAPNAVGAGFIGSVRVGRAKATVPGWIGCGTEVRREWERDRPGVGGVGRCGVRKWAGVGGVEAGVEAGCLPDRPDVGEMGRGFRVKSAVRKGVGGGVGRGLDVRRDEKNSILDELRTEKYDFYMGG